MQASEVIMKLILASNSPRRKQILTDMGLEFEIIPSNYDEKLSDNIFSYEKIEDLATQKCLDVVRRVKDGETVLAADTVVVLHNKILGKPHSKEEAFEKLLTRIHPGAIVLLHSTSSTNAQILDELLNKWEDMGYSFHSLNELIRCNFSFSICIVHCHI